MSQNVIVQPLDAQRDFARAVLDSLPGLLLVTAVAIVANVVAPKLEAYPLFKTYLSLKDFILAIIFGMIIRNTVGVPAVFQPGLRYSTILTKTASWSWAPATRWRAWFPWARRRWCSSPCSCSARRWS
jgi:hypothetical protein